MRSRYSQIQSDRCQKSETAMYSGFWHGRPVTFPRDFRGHRFSDEECEALCKGQRIEVHNIQGMNCKYAVQGRLQVQDIGLGPSVRFVVIDTVPNNPDYVFGMELYPVSDTSELSDVWKDWDETGAGEQKDVPERRPFNIQKAFAASRNRISEIEKQGDRHVFVEPETSDVSDVFDTFDESEMTDALDEADVSDELELSDAEMAYMLGETDAYEESLPEQTSEPSDVSDVSDRSEVQEESMVPEDAEVLVDEDAEAAVAEMMKEEEEQIQEMSEDAALEEAALAGSDGLSVTLPSDETPDGDFSDIAYDFDGYGVGVAEQPKAQEATEQKFSDDSGVNAVFADYLRDEDSEDAMSEGFAYADIVEEEQYEEYWEEVAELDRKTAELAGDHPWDDPTKPVSEELMQSVANRSD